MDKSLTIGYSGKEAPADKIGAGAATKEDLDYAVKIVTWGQGELLNMGINTKKKKKIIKSILEIKKQFPQYNSRGIANCFISKIKQREQRENDKQLFKSILDKTKKCYPDISFENIVYLATEVYKKQLRKSRSHKYIKKIGTNIGFREKKEK